MNFSQRSNVQNYPSGLTLSNGELFPNATESSSGQIANLKGLPDFRSATKKTRGRTPCYYLLVQKQNGLGDLIYLSAIGATFESSVGPTYLVSGR